MIITKICLFCFVSIVFSLLLNETNCATVQKYPIRSDAIVTTWPEVEDVANEENPGWMRRQLIRFGQVASRVGNAMGTHATKITAAVDKICEIVKTVIPLLAAVCHVGQFKFCMATEQAPDTLADAMSPTSLNLDVPDK